MGKRVNSDSLRAAPRRPTAGHRPVGESFAMGERDRLSAVVDAELRQDPLDVSRDRLWADDKAPRDRIRIQAICQEGEDFSLAAGQIK